MWQHEFLCAIRWLTHDPSASAVCHISEIARSTCWLVLLSISMYSLRWGLTESRHIVQSVLYLPLACDAFSSTERVTQPLFDVECQRIGKYLLRCLMENKDMFVSLLTRLPLFVHTLAPTSQAFNSTRLATCSRWISVYSICHQSSSFSFARS